MNLFASILFLASAAFAAPQYYYNPGQQYYYRQNYGQYGFGNNYNPQPQPLNNFRYGQNPLRNQVYNVQSNFGQNPLMNQAYTQQSRSFGQNSFRNQQFNQQSNIPSIPTVRGTSVQTDFGNFDLPSQNLMTREQRAQYLPVMKALLKVMESRNPSARDVNTLMVLTRDLSKQVPKDQNILGRFGNFGLDGLESMGLPEYGDIITNVDGVPHIQTQWGAFPLSNTSLMTDEEKARFLPAVRTFTSVLQKDNVDPNEISLLMEQAKELSALIPGNMQDSIGSSIGNLFSV